jgi:ABC-2 type transport system ATP-binding protein
MLTGQILPNCGSIDVLGTNPIDNPLYTKEKVGIIPEQETPPSFLTVTEYLNFVASVRELDGASKKIKNWLEFLDLKKEKDYIIKNLSRGTKQKILFIQAFIHEPKVVFIDEPLINLDPIMQKKIKKFLREYVAKENTIFLSTHILSIAEEICDEVCILRYGKILYQGEIKEIKKKNKNLEDYFVKLIENEK